MVPERQGVPLPPFIGQEAAAPCAVASSIGQGAPAEWHGAAFPGAAAAAWQGIPG